jgi:hypothetical protein
MRVGTLNVDARVSIRLPGRVHGHALKRGRCRVSNACAPLQLRQWERTSDDADHIHATALHIDGGRLAV